KENLAADLERFDQVARIAAIDPAEINRQIQARVSDVTAPRRQTIQARQMLRRLLAGKIELEPVGSGRERAYKFRGALTIEKLIAGEAVLSITHPAMVAPTGFEPVFESRSRFRQVSYVVTEQQHPATSTRLKHAAECSLKHPEHDHVKREPGGPSPDERKLQNNFRTGAVEAAASRTQFWLRRVHEVRVAMGTIQRIFRDLGRARRERPGRR